uniref:Proteoglycan-4-like n=1 Tax=Tineola bisselliella TaxID=93883 RepID=A0A891XJ65_TINBI|nr:proteoglycan-4-like [Tineola bisselliella]
MSVVLNAICVFVCCSKLVASIPFPEEYVRRYLAAANGASASTGMQDQLQHQQTMLNPSQVTAYAGQLNNAHSQPGYPSISNTENYFQPMNNVGRNLNFPRDLNQESYEAMRAGVPVQANAQASSGYFQTNQVPRALEQDVYKKQLQQLKEIVPPKQIPYNSPINIATQSYGSTLQQLQKAQSIRQYTNQDFPSINQLNRKQLTGVVSNEERVSNTKSQLQDMNTYINNPKIQNIISKTKLKKRYLVVHPDGTVNHVDNLDEVVKENPNYVLLNSGRIKASHLASNKAQTGSSTSASTDTNILQNKPLDIKQFRVTEVTSPKKSLPKIIEKPIINKDTEQKSNLKKLIVASHQNKNDDLKRNKAPIKVLDKSNENSEAATASNASDNDKAKIKNVNEHVKENSSTTSAKVDPEATKKPSIKFSVKKSLKTNKNDNSNQSSPINSESDKETISKDNKIVSMKPKSSSASEQNKSHSKAPASAHKDYEKKSNKGIETKHDEVFVESNTGKGEENNSKIRKVNNTSVSTSNNNKKETIANTTKINKETSNGETTKLHVDQEKTLKVIPVTKDDKKVTKPNNKGNSRVVSNESVHPNVQKPLKSKTGNVVVINEAKTKSDEDTDSNDETSKIMNLLKSIGKKDMEDKVVILLVMPPIVDREVHTTIYPDGTIIDEITETTWDSEDEDAEPKVATRTNVRHFDDPPSEND